MGSPNAAGARAFLSASPSTPLPLLLPRGLLLAEPRADRGVTPRGVRSVLALAARGVSVLERGVTLTDRGVIRGVPSSPMYLATEW